MRIWSANVRLYLINNARLTSSGSTLRIGNVWKSLHKSEKEWLVPSTNTQSQAPQSVLKHLKWILQKDIAKQDIFLIGHPGPNRRRLASLYCELSNREVEYLVLSRDTTEGDIKQRKEISSGSSQYIPGPAVRAACSGRALIIEGIERAEQNLLPILNNLLENREMHLEDGRFLVAPDRYDTLINPSSDLVRVHQDFWVIALGVPVPPYKGYPLDPPLRSRFQARVIDDLPFNEQKAQLISEYGEAHSKKIHSLLSFSSFFKEEAANNLPFLSSSSVDKLGGILRNVPSIGTHHLVEQVYPYKTLLQKDTSDNFTKMLTDLNITSTGARDQCYIKDISDNLATVMCKRHQFTVPAGAASTNRGSSVYTETASQEALISDMILSHSVADICLIGPSGCGKSVVINEFARRLGYDMDTLVLYNDMTSRDLLQHRHTDTSGNTVWEHSPLVRAALEGKLLVLDSLHKLHHTAVATLASLCEDRQLSLPDGMRLVAQETHNLMCERQGLSREELCERGVLPIHPAFRIIATGEDKSDWITSELLGMWHYHHHNPLTSEEQFLLLSKLCPDTTKKQLKLVQKLSAALQSHSDPVISGIGSTLTLRRLVAICRSVAEEGVTLGHVIHTSLLTRFMPMLTRQTLASTLEELGVYESNRSDDIRVTLTPDTVTIGSVTMGKLKGDKDLVPATLFYENKNQLYLLEELLRSFSLGDNILLVGNQGVGKNKLVDRLLELLEGSREYLQLHRDSTVQSITVQPTISGGRVEYSDSALVRAVRSGRVLVVDEADKAPTNVTSVLRNLLDTGSMWLSDGRKIVPHDTPSSELADKDIVCHPAFRAVFLANRPGFPFLGNDFYAVMGDLLSCHAVDNPDPPSEMALLKQYGPDVPEDILWKLIGAFSELRSMSDAGTFLYPYSTRELVNIVKHMQAYPEDGITVALCNVLDFEQQTGDIWDFIVSVLHKHDIPFGARPIANVSPRFALSPPTSAGTLKLQDNTVTGRLARYATKSRGPFILSHYDVDVPVSQDRAKYFNERTGCRLLPLPTAQTKYTHLLSGGEDTLHVLSTSPDVLYTIHNNKPEVAALNISPSLGYYLGKHDLTAAAYKELALLADKSTGSVLLINTERHTVERVEMGKTSYFKSKPPGRYHRVHPGREEHCWVSSDNVLCRYNLPQRKASECELPFNISEVSQSTLNPDCDELIVKSDEGVWYFVRVTADNFTCTEMHAELGLEGPWLQDNAAGLKTDLPYSSDVVLSSGDVLIADKCVGSLSNNGGPVQLRRLETEVPALGGLLTKGLLVHPVKSLPDAYKPTTPGPAAPDTGYLAVVDIVKYSISLLPLHQTRSKSRFDDPMNTLAVAQNNDRITTLSPSGILQDWELSDESLAVSYKTWRAMVGEPPTQLNIDRDSGLDVSEPKHGKIDPDNTPHVGGNTWAGGTGGRDTAGLGGKGGPYRLDAGHNVHQLSDEEKNSVPEEVQAAAREMGKKAFEKRLQEIRMSNHDSERYNSFVAGVRQQISSLKQLAAGLEAKQGDRVWIRNQTDGELDDAKLVEGLTGERSIYKRRGIPQEKSHNMVKPKHLTMLVDVSGSMYRFNGVDKRLQRELEVMAMVMEGLHGSESRVRYDIIGHSGEDPHVSFVKRDLPPDNEKKRLQVLEEMHTHSQYCWSGDHTVHALEMAISHAAKIDADDRIVIAFSDANLERYFIRPSTIASLMSREPRVAVYMIFIGSLGNEAQRLRKVLPAGKSFVTMDTKDIPKILQQIFSTTMIQ